MENTMTTAATSNKVLVLEAFDLLFNRRDYDAAEGFWSESYIQHSALIAPGREALFHRVRSLPSLRYENQFTVAEGDYVMLYGRFSGINPEAMVTANVVRGAGRSARGALGHLGERGHQGRIAQRKADVRRQVSGRAATGVDAVIPARRRSWRPRSLVASRRSRRCRFLCMAGTSGTRRT